MLIAQGALILTLIFLNLFYIRMIDTNMPYTHIIAVNLIILLISSYLIYIIFRMKENINVSNRNTPTQDIDILNNSSHITNQASYLVNTDNIEKSELISILNAIKEGILVLSDDNIIMYYNNSFLSQFSIAEKVRGKDYHEVVHIPLFDKFVQSLKKMNIPHHSQEILYKNKIFLLSASISQMGKIFVIVFHDVSEVRSLEKIKKDFIINASHELRTPLTSIKGFLELAEKEPNNNLKYIEIISRNTERIINIINDLLKLSKLESTSSILSKEDVNINDLILNNLILFEQRIQDKGLSLELDLTTEEPLIIPMDKLKIEEVIINLIDNAIKYTETGTIHISSRKNNGNVNIIIRDTGIGIPEKYYSRIFERFYVVDKARSRKTGGTGLGLAIVKHIIQLHQGKIDVASTLGKGTEFIITLPRQPLF